MDAKALLRYCQSQTPAMLRCLRKAVELESPSSSQQSIEQLARFLVQEFKRSGGKGHLLPHPKAGPALSAEFWPEVRGAKPILLLGHLDTVWEKGTLAEMPFRMKDGRAYGPGIFDMKSGIICGLWAVRALRALRVVPSSRVRFLLDSDEEIGSEAFRKQILTEAKRSRAVLVLEPAAAGGALKTARKGVGDFKVTVHGRSAHAGINPGAGVNAVTELARQVLRIEGMARPRQGLTVNVDVIQGGTRPNVIPERATAWVDVRIPRIRDAEAIEKRIFGLKPLGPGARLEIAGGINRPPLERKMALALFRKAQDLGRAMGMELQEASTGGGSDGNFTAASGIPTLDGLGGVGDGAHARHEHVIIRELPRRAALLAALIATL